MTSSSLVAKLRRPPFPSGWSSLPITPGNLTLSNTLPVGQSFLWHRHTLDTETDATEEYSRAIDNPPRVVCLRQSPTALYFTAVHPTTEATEADQKSGLTRAWLEDYFQLARYPDLEAMYAEWRKRDPLFFGKVELGERAVGVRVLRQDTWETVVAFITSTNNHIPRITSLLHRLCERFSEPVLSLDHPGEEGEPVVYRLFPRPDDFPTDGLEPILRELGFGYRAAYLDSALASLRADGRVSETLDGLRGSSLQETRERLIRLKGVGKKVADCIGLMCMDQPSVIPVDTHIYSIAARHPSFPAKLKKKAGMSAALYDDIQEFLAEQWGPLGGWTQAVVFAADLKPSVTTPKKQSRSATPLIPPKKESRSATPLITPKKESRASTPPAPLELKPKPLPITSPKSELLEEPELKRPRRSKAQVSYKVK